jgi:DNA-nicking Smr family endonuclease
MRRRLSAEEAALWARVAASVRPLPGRRAPALPVPPKAEPPRTVAPAPAKATPPPKPRPAPPRMSVTSATLDGGWDRRLASGQAHPDDTIELHGHTLAAAHARLDLAVEMAVAEGARVLLIVTGKGSSGRPGLIRAELADWLDGSRHRARIAALRPAHRRHGGGGAFYLVLRRPR